MLERYGSSATIHGISYIFTQNNKFVVRKVFWLLVLIASLFFAFWWSRHIYVSWKSDPVLTTIENFAYPIQKIKFPSITICPQGADNSILRSVLFKQFNEYLSKKNLNLEELTIDEAKQQSLKFLNETYPGAKQSPDSYVTLFRTQNLKSNIRTQANINPEDNTQNCSSTFKSTNRRKRTTHSDSCPKSTIPNGHGKCFHLASNQHSYSDAITYCENVVSDRQSQVHQFLEDSDFTSLYEILDECMFHVYA